MLAVWGLGAPLVHAFGVQEVPKLAQKEAKETKRIAVGLYPGLGRPPGELTSHRS